MGSDDNLHMESQQRGRVYRPGPFTGINKRTKVVWAPFCSGNQAKIDSDSVFTTLKLHLHAYTRVFIMASSDFGHEDESFGGICYSIRVCCKKTSSTQRRYIFIKHGRKNNCASQHV